MMSLAQQEWLYRLALLILLMCFALWSVLQLEGASRSIDEGFNLMKARMVKEGYVLHRDIWSDQPPLFTLCLAYAFDLFSESVLVARGVVVAFACLGLISTAWMARLLGGRVGSLVAVVFLTLSPQFLELSRSVMIGLPANALAALAMTCGLMALQTKREAWLAAAGLSISASLLTKPIQPFVLVPFGMIIWWWGKGSEGTLWQRWGRNVLLMTVAVVVPLLVVLSLFGGPLLVEQVVGTYLQRQVSEPFRFSLVISDTVAYLRDGGLLYWTGVLLALHGLVLTWRRRDSQGMAVSAWLLSALVVVYSQARFRPRYLLLLSLPAAGLLSVGLQDVTRKAALAWKRPRRQRMSLAVAGTFILFLTLGAMGEVRTALAEPCCSRNLAEEQAVELLRSIVTPGGYVISDDGFLPFRAGLLAPPQLAVISGRRKGTGQLSAERLIAVTQAYEPEAIIPWKKRLVAVPGYLDWVNQHYCLVRTWHSSHSQRIYAPCEMLEPCDECLVQLGDSFGLVGWDVSSPGRNDRVVAPGERLLLTLRWKVLQATDDDHHVFGHLGTDTVVVQWDGKPQGGKYPTYQWIQGEEVVDSYTLEVPADAPDSRYPLWVGMYDWATKDRLPVKDAQGHYVGSEALLTHVRVGRPKFEVPPISQVQKALLGDRIRLLGYDLALDEAQAGGVIGLTLYWQCVEEMDTNYTVFVHVLGSEGKMAGQWDSVPQGGGLPTTIWVPGEVVVDGYQVPVAQEARPGSYTLVVGMYDGGTGQRLTAADGAGETLPSDEILLRDIQLSE